MKNYILLILLALSFGSCSTYQYITLDSPQTQKNDRKEFVWENDSLKLVYNFHGEGGPLNLTVYNKLNEPLYVNWKKSALIRDGQSISLFNRSVIVNRIATPYQEVKNNPNLYPGLSATFELPEGIEFISPASYVSKALLDIQELGLGNLPGSDSLRPQKYSQNGMVTGKFTRARFDESQSPLRFSTYLTFMVGQHIDKEFAVQHSFYAKEILQTHDEPDLFALYNSAGDKWYVKQPAQ